MAKADTFVSYPDTDAQLRSNLEVVSDVAGRLAETITTGARMSVKALARDLGLTESDVQAAVEVLHYGVDSTQTVEMINSLTPQKSLPASTRRAVAA